RVFPDIAIAVRARMQGVTGSALEDGAARLLVERGLVPVHHGGGMGYAWSSDPRLTLPTMVRMTEPQVRDLIGSIQCPVRVIHSDSPQPYLPEPLRSERASILNCGELVEMPGGHHLNMEQPAEVAAVIGDFFRR